MKRSLAAALCAGAVLTGLVCGAVALAEEDSLISLSYITDIFYPDALKQGTELAREELKETYDDALEDLEEVQGELMEQAVGTDGLYSGDLRPRTLSRDSVFTVGTGAGFILHEGTARVEHDGAVIDVTDGIELPSGERPVRGHRYLVGEDTQAEITVLSGSAQLGVQGSYEQQAGEKNSLPFYDVCSEDWYYDAVDYVYNAGIFTGVSQTEFSPHRTMDRAMLMTGFYRLAGSPERELKEATASYSDVAESAWYYTFVRWAGTQEITAGIGDNKFGPSIQLTREQVVTLLYAFATRYMGMTLDGRTDVSGYADYEQSSQWARDALSWAVHYGILDSSWAGENTLGGHLYADRAEVAAMLAAFEQEIL